MCMSCCTCTHKAYRLIYVIHVFFLQVGSHMLALAAREFGIPCYAVCSMYKISYNRETVNIELEEKSPQEVVGEGWRGGGGVKIRNVYFELVPYTLLKGVVMEEGIEDPVRLWDRARAFAERFELAFYSA